VIVCDCGTNFVGASHEIVTMQIEWDEVRREKMMIEFRFAPPHSSHFSGLIETKIKAAKKAFLTCTLTSVPTDNKLSVAFYKAADYLNNMPVAHTARDAGDLNHCAITPSHFIMGAAYNDLAPANPEHTKLLVRYQRLNDMMEHFWDRLTKELTTFTRPTDNWKAVKRDLQLGDVVMHLESSERGKYPLARVVGVKKGVDGHVRRISIKESEGGQIDRSINNVVLILPVEEQDRDVRGAVQTEELLSNSAPLKTTYGTPPGAASVLGVDLGDGSGSKQKQFAAAPLVLSRPAIAPCHRFVPSTVESSVESVLLLRESYRSLLSLRARTKTFLCCSCSPFPYLTRFKTDATQRGETFFLL
jgi:hypothetical protein